MSGLRTFGAMTDTPHEVEAALAALTAPTRKVDTALLGDVRHGLEQLPDDGSAPVFTGTHADLAVRRRTL